MVGEHVAGIGQRAGLEAQAAAPDTARRVSFLRCARLERERIGHLQVQFSGMAIDRSDFPRISPSLGMTLHKVAQDIFNKSRS